MAYHKDGIPMPEKCFQCSVKLRRGPAQPGDTESRWYGGKGLCAACYKAAKIAAKGSDAPDIPPARHAANISGLVGYIRARRNRGVLPEGTIPDPTVLHAAIRLEALEEEACRAH